MMVPPQVVNPLIDCRPLRQAIRYGQVAQCSKTSVLLESWLASLEGAFQPKTSAYMSFHPIFMDDVCFLLLSL